MTNWPLVILEKRKVQGAKQDESHKVDADGLTILLEKDQTTVSIKKFSLKDRKAIKLSTFLQLSILSYISIMQGEVKSAEQHYTYIITYNTYIYITHIYTFSPNVGC